MNKTTVGYVVLADNPADGTWAADNWGGADFAVFTGPRCWVYAVASAKRFKSQGFRNVRVQGVTEWLATVDADGTIVHYGQEVKA